MSGNNIGYLSPANSLLYFDGGVDYFFGKMFPKLEEDAQKMVEKYGFLSEGIKLGASKFIKKKHYLPIGSAMIISVDHCVHKTKYNYIIACPTMFVPSVIIGTKNVYYAFYAGLAAIDKFNKSNPEYAQIKTIIVPGFGTGCGRLSNDESVSQMYDAFVDFLAKKNNNDKCMDDNMVYIHKVE